MRYCLYSFRWYKNSWVLSFPGHCLVHKQIWSCKVRALFPVAESLLYSLGGHVVLLRSPSVTYPLSLYLSNRDFDFLMQKLFWLAWATVWLKIWFPYPKSIIVHLVELTNAGETIAAKGETSWASAVVGWQGVDTTCYASSETIAGTVAGACAAFILIWKKNISCYHITYRCQVICKLYQIIANHSHCKSH